MNPSPSAFTPRDRPAFRFAEAWHRGQTRKGIHREDFIQHPLRVAERLAACGTDDGILLDAALLHDVLEDTACPPEHIADTFGEPVLEIVREVTDDKTLLKSERKQRQVERAEYLSPAAGLVRLADKIDNVRSLVDDPPPTWGWPRRRAYVAWASRVVRRIPDPPPGLWEEFWRERDAAWRVVTGTDS